MIDTLEIYRNTFYKQGDFVVLIRNGDITATIHFLPLCKKWFKTATNLMQMNNIMSRDDVLCLYQKENS